MTLTLILTLMMTMTIIPSPPRKTPIQSFGKTTPALIYVIYSLDVMLMLIIQRTIMALPNCCPP